MKKWRVIGFLLPAVLWMAACSKEEKEPEYIDGEVAVTLVKVNGVVADFDESTSTFSVLIPTCTDFSKCSLVIETEAEWILHGKERILRQNLDLDLSEPLRLAFIKDNVRQFYCIKTSNTGLPVVRINTPGRVAVTSKEQWLEGADIRIELPEGTCDFEGKTSIRGRGNSTWNYPKKPYALKLDQKSEILGMPAHKRWILLANWKDRTLMRNDAAFWLSAHTDLPYTVRGSFVELVFNEKHVGNYYLCEQIKLGDDRVPADKKDGGYLLELDTYFDEPLKFIYPDLFNLPWMVKQPDEDEITEEGFNYIKEYIYGLETLLKDEERVKAHEYEAFLDVDSAIDYLIVEELTMNNDFFNTWPWAGPHSSYVFKKGGGKLYHGPVWDFDYHAFCPQFVHSWTGATRTMFYPALLKDPKFCDRLLERWEMQKETLKGLPDYIDQTVARIAVSEALNHEMWPINTNSENGDEQMSHAQSIERIKRSFLNKWEWIDQNIGKVAGFLK